MNFGQAFMGLYIPLCLYFNETAGADETDGDNFTFHYVSILIEI